MSLPEDERTPWQAARDSTEETGAWPEHWGPYHRHFASDAIHRDGGPECDQPGTSRRVYVFDDDTLRDHEAIVARWAASQALAEITRPVLPFVTVICPCGIRDPHCHCDAYPGPHRHPAEAGK